MPTQAWDQLPNEPPEAYARFLVYRNLGPTRAVDSAYAATSTGAKRGKARRASGQWFEDSAAYDWRRRAAQWDIAQLASVVPETTGLIFEAIAEYARQVLNELQAGKHRPKSWVDLRESLVVLAGFVSPEVITAAVDHAGAAVGPNAPGGADDRPDAGGDVAGGVPQP